MNYMNLVTKIEPRGWKEINGMNCRTLYHIGDRFIVEVSITEHDRADRDDLCNLWKKAGYISDFLPTTAHITTYYTDIEGHCSGLYNIQHTRDSKIDFTYMLEATRENVEKLVKECIRMREMDIR